MNISAFSKKYAISTDTLRFYEELEILIPERSANRYRRYTPVHEEQIKLIIVLKSVGFSLNEIKQFVQMGQRDASEACNTISNQLVDEKLKQMTRQIEILQLGKVALTHFKAFIHDNQYEKNQTQIQHMLDQLYNKARSRSD